MNLADWFTVISILLAVVAFFPNEERRILFLKIPKFMKVGIFVILFLLIPFLIFYGRLSVVFPRLNSKPFILDSRFLPSPNVWAFILFFCLLMYSGWWFFFRIRKVKPTKELIDYYLSCMDMMPFEALFRLFIKYEQDYFKSEAGYIDYKKLLGNEQFFKYSMDNNPGLYLNLILNIDAPSFLDWRIPVILRDKINNVIAQQGMLGVNSAYNYEPILHDNWPEEDLLLFKLLNCYISLMEKCIDVDIFTSTKSDTSMTNHFMETFFDGILKNINISNNLNVDKEEPTFFHKLLIEILHALKSWIDHIGRETDEIERIRIYLVQYVRCIAELIQFDSTVVSNYFLNIQFNSLMRLYFEKPVMGLNDEKISFIREVIENTFLRFAKRQRDNSSFNYCKNRFISCWDYAENDLFVGHTMPLETARFEKKLSILLNE